MTDKTITYDRFGRMEYHPGYHPNHCKPFSDYEISYLCKFWDVDDRMDMSLALGRTETTLSNRVSRMKKDGSFEMYKNKYDELVD